MKAKLIGGTHHGESHRTDGYPYLQMAKVEPWTPQVYRPGEVSIDLKREIETYERRRYWCEYLGFPAMIECYVLKSMDNDTAEWWIRVTDTQQDW